VIYGGFFVNYLLNGEFGTCVFLYSGKENSRMSDEGRGFMIIAFY
jgi:hypothetical protein